MTAPGKAISGTAFATLLLIALMMGANHVAARIAFNHDVNGITPGPGGNFLENRKSLTLGVEGTYLNAWAADFSYTRFYGADELNLIHDRDFVSLSVRYSF